MAEESSIASEVLAASLGGAISASILYPLEVLKTKMQAETKSIGNDDDNNKDKDDGDSEDRSNLSMVEYAKHLYNTQGWRVFVQGVETSAFQSATEKALYFFAYTAMKQVVVSLSSSSRKNHPNNNNNNTNIGTVPNLMLGCIAEWAHLPITLPLDCWTTKIQTDTSGKGAMPLLLAMLSEKGLKGMYKGIQAYTVLCWKPALQYTVFEQVKAIVVQNRRSKQLSAAEAFLLGMVARTISTVLVFPYVRAKVMLQTMKTTTTTTSGTNDEENQVSIPKLLKDMYARDGISAWFQGLGPELTRGVLSSALMLMIKEQIANVVHVSLYGPPKVQQQQLRH